MIISKPSPPTQFFLIILFATFLFRLPLIQSYMGFTSDMGSYLMTRNWVLMDDPTAGMLAHYRPPIIGAILIPFTRVLGDLTGSKLLAILASVSMAPGFYLLARRFLSPWWAVGASVVILYYPNYGEMTVGGYLSLFGFGLMSVLLWSLYKLKEGPSLTAGRIHLLSLFLLIGLNQTISAWYIFLAFVIMGTSLLSKWRTSAIRMGSVLGVSLIISSVWLPFYLLHSPGLDNPLQYPGRFLIPNIQPWILIQGAFFSLVLLWSPKRWGHLALPGLILAVSGSWFSSDVIINNQMGRAVHILPIFTVLLTGGLVQSLWPQGIRLDTTLRAGLNRFPVVSIATILILFSLGNFVWMARFSLVGNGLNMLTRDNLAGVRWIESNTSPDSGIFTHPNGLGWWVGGMVKRRWSGSWMDVAPRGFQPHQAAFQCAVRWRIDCDPSELSTLGYQYIFVDTSRSIPIHNPLGIQPQDFLWDRLWDVPDKAPNLIPVFRKGDVVIYRLKEEEY